MLLSYDQEKALGKSARKDVERQFGGVVKDKKLNGYVNSVGQKIAGTIRKKVESKNSDQEVDYEFKVLNSKVINAFCLPGGYVYITRGLLSKLEDESQLAAVLGHEAGHAVGRHSAEQLSKQIAIGTLLGAGVAATASRDTKQARKNAAKVSAVGNVVGGLIMLGFSRDDEAEADELGTKFTYNTGYDPRGMIGVLKILQKENKGGESNLMEIFQTHPNTKRRIADVDKEIRKKYPHLETEGPEKFSIVKTLKAIEEAHVVLYLIDARLGVSEQDLKLLGFILECGSALVIAMNKWDGLKEEVKNQAKIGIDRHLDFVSFARIHYISALHGTNVGNLFDSIDEAYLSATKKIATPLINQLLQRALLTHSPPLVSGRRVKLRYAHLGGHNPPRIIIHGNQLKALPLSYRRFLSHFFQTKLELYGTPVCIEFKTSDNPFTSKKTKKTRS